MKIAEFLIEKPVTSTWISNIAYNRNKRIATMRLSNGRTFSIPGVTRTTFEKWTNSPSKGEFFHAAIKGRYNIQRIK